MSQDAPTNAAATETAPDRRSEFVPVGPGGETSSAEALLITAYVLMWAFIFGLVFLSQRRQQKLEARLSELEAALAQRDRADAGPGGVV